MQIINALTLTPDVKNWLGTSYHPRFLHIFDRACNLINEHGDILSIVTRQIGNGPFNLVVENSLCFSHDLHLKAPISLFPTQLMLGKLIVHTADAKVWYPCPDWETLQNRKADIRNSLLQLPITNYLNSSGFDTPLGQPSGHDIPNTQSLLSDFCSTIVNADISGAKKKASKLAGLGPGLTPSGDDYLVGALHAAWIIHPFTVASVLGQEIASTAAPLTTSLSAAWIRSAGKGEAGVLWHDFFDALVSSNTPRMQETIKKMLAVGETSGADALAGFVGVFASWIGQTGAFHG